MKEKRLYTCDICNTDYSEKQKAMECEKNQDEAVGVDGSVL